MKIAYGHHARDRMSERGITEQDIRSVLEFPDTVTPTPKNSVCCIGEPQPGRRLKVWVFPYDTDSDMRRVKSTAWKDEDDV
ncbi:DUF4258 domain-containing protein [Jatrophihabitans lederbergiae]|uniref:DUF4258 domain-containing protein n=1 Tax=Jatrophihabitans lederbergiae TaxID=3075547 RepID=UPI0037BF293E